MLIVVCEDNKKVIDVKTLSRYLFYLILVFVFNALVATAAEVNSGVSTSNIFEKQQTEFSSSINTEPDSLGQNIPLILKSNLIYDAVLAPSVELEYLINRKWSLGVETSIAWWHNNNKHWYYQIATIIPELRYRFSLGKSGQSHSIGIFAGAGWYDLEYKKTGYQGELWMTGLSYCYTFPIRKNLGFEAGAGFGFMSAKYEEYLPQDGHYAYQQTTRTNFWEPLRLKFALYFDFSKILMKGGGR